MKQFLRLKGLGEVIDCSILNGFHCVLGRRVGRDHQHGKVGPRLLEPRQEIIAAHPAEHGVGDDHEELFTRDESQRFLGAFDGAGMVALVAEHGLQRQAHVPFVIDDQDGW